MAASLDNLVGNLKSGGSSKFRFFNEAFKDSTGELQDLLRQKGVFPYEWNDNLDKLKVTALPSREAFFSKLTGEHCDEADYARAQRVWELSCNNFEDYLLLYLKTDVFLLADVFENFREVWYGHHKLDALNYITLPGLSWASMLKMLRDTKATLNLKASMTVDDADIAAAEEYPDGIECFHVGQLPMLEFVTGGDNEPSQIRGGVCAIIERFAEANNPYLGTGDQFNAYKADRAKGLPCLSPEEAFAKYGWNPSEPASYIMYWDANNLYGWAMSQYLPIGDYGWLLERNGSLEKVTVDSDGYGSEDALTAHFTPEVILAMKHDGPKGCMLEVDLTYPRKLHDSHNALPLAPENVCFTPSPTTVALQQKLGLKNDSLPKLIPNLHDKVKYKVHYRALQQMLQLGMILTRVHRVLEFKQYPILKSYIDFNTAQRAKATNDFEKDLYKLANNAIYGKTNENVENHISVKFAQNEKRALYYAGLPRTTGFRIFSNNLTAYKMLQSRVTYNRPVMVGAAILDISKTLVFDFHYNYVLPKYGKNARLLFTDTDSLCYHITTPDIYEDMRSSSTLFDMAGYEPRFQTLADNAVFNKENKKVIGKMKDEQAEPCSKQDCERCRGSTPLPHAIRAFCGLRAKMYACELIEHSSKMAAKGVKKSHVKSHRGDKSLLIQQRDKPDKHLFLLFPLIFPLPDYFSHPSQF